MSPASLIYFPGVIEDAWKRHVAQISGATTSDYSLMIDMFLHTWFIGPPSTKHGLLTNIEVPTDY